MSTEHIKKLIRVKQPFKRDCIVWFAAPYSQPDECTLPEGLVLHLYEFPERAESERYEASPAQAQDWAPYLLSSSNRFDRNFRGDISFHLGKNEIDQYCEIIDEIPQQEPPPLRYHRALQGCLFGTMTGDAIGLPFEGLSPSRIQKLKAFPLRQRFLFGRGMMSDDTEHTCMVAQALIQGNGDPKMFARLLAWSMRFWLLGLPAGIGLATLRACIKLWLGFPPAHSGVFSAGNGPAMRSAIIGVYAADDRELRHALININTRITHTDPKALRGSLIVAELAAQNAQGNLLTTNNCIPLLQDIIKDDDELKQAVQNAIDSAERGETAIAFWENNYLGNGVSGYMYHTLPVVLQIVLRHNNNYAQAINEAVCCGGDTDTVAAIIGGIVGARVGTAGIPEHWLQNCKDWPRDKTYLRLLGEELAMSRWLKQPGAILFMDPIRIWIRNAFFMIWVLAHGFRRLLPPY